MAERYWATIFRGAWEKTSKPLGWDRKKSAVVLVAVGAVIAAGFRLGWSAMITTAAGYVWIAAPAAFAAFVLFVWGMVETQAKLYGELYQTSGDKIAALQTELAKYTSKYRKPNYPAIRLQHQYSLDDASRLWVDLDPNSPSTDESKAWFRTFISAIQQGQLKITSKWRSHERDMVEYERKNPDWNTKVSRKELQRYAASIDQNPQFLRDE